jgi:Flp pilus assembly protein TadG
MTTAGSGWHPVKMHRGKWGASLSRASGRKPISETGVSAVEFALVLPVLVLIVGAIVDFGFLFSQQIAFNTAARDAARSAVRQDLSGARPSCATVATNARASAASGAGAIGANATAIAVSVVGPDGSCSLPAGSVSASGAALYPCVGSSGASTPRTQVTLSYASTPPFPLPFMGAMTLTARGDFTCEYTS